MKLIVFTFLFCLYSIISHGQNLIVNGSFEEYKKCPKTITTKKLKLKKVTSIKGTPDYFNTCSQGLANPSHNLFGQQAPFHGNGFLGIILTSSNTPECYTREYFELSLTQPLIAGNKYELEFMVSASDLSGYFTDQIGAVFTQNSLKKVGVSKFIGHPHVNNPLNNFIADTVNWVAVKLIYNAKGDEQYLTIGNFQKCNYTTRISINTNDSVGTMQNMKRIYDRDFNLVATELSPDEFHIKKTIDQLAYYYIDNVTLTPSKTNKKLIYRKPKICPTLTKTERNLLPDPTFNTSKNRKNKYWSSPTKGTPDFTNGQAGIYLYSNNHINNREYITAMLDTTLTNCDSIYFEMKIKPTANHGYVVDKIGMALVDSFTYQSNRGLIPMQASLESNSFEILENGTNWITICGILRPESCVNQIIIGNFSSDDSTYIVPMSSDPNSAPYAHYAVDNVILQKFNSVGYCNVQCAPEIIKDNLVQTDSLIDFNSHYVHFRTNQIKIDNADANWVSQLQLTLQKYPQSYVQVEGHTDNVGPSTVNLAISRERAQNLAHFLIDKGISESRINVLFYGETAPLAPNTTEKNKAKNRRVTVTLVK